MTSCEDRQRPPRTAWGVFPDVLIFSKEMEVKRHPDYVEAKAGDADAATRLVQDLVTQENVDTFSGLIDGKQPLLVAVHALEKQGINEIPVALCTFLADRLGLPVDSHIIQANVVGHTSADGFTRLAKQAVFDGKVQSGQDYVIIDDFVGQGGTLANLKGYIESNGGKVLGSAVLTGRPYSAKLRPDDLRIKELRGKHGQIETWWHDQFGFSFNELTESEARYLCNTKDADTIRNRVAEKGQAGSPSENEGSDSRLISTAQDCSEPSNES